MRDIVARIRTLHPAARLHADYIVCADPDHPGEELLTFWNADTLGGRDDAALAAIDILTPSLIAYAAAKRWTVETGGITVMGAPIATDRESQAMIAGAFNFVTQNPSAMIKWKSEGGFVTLDAAAITALANAVGSHVQACFAAEADVVAGIMVSPPTITTTEQIDAAF